MPKKTLEIRDKTIFDGLFVKYILKMIFKTWFKITGWKPTKSAPEGAGITIAAPHTSNWDVVYAFGSAILLDIKIYFSIKESWCRIPVIGSLMMWCGAIPIDRSSGSQGQVNKIKRFVEKHKGSRVFFLFTPEGTRGKIDKWKSGFYHMAKSCHLPIFLAKVDYRTKESGVFHTYKLTGDKSEDIRAIQESYKSVKAKFPAIQFPKYTGPLPELSDAEALILKAFYSAKGVATQMEIAAKTKAHHLSTSMLDFLVEKGFLEKLENLNCEPTYKLTFAGRGRLLHFYPALA
ncbi:MAG: 1-acyl-sn-glycerol-3-phosphate acyltransferase [Enterobacterales bacterium]|jgi:1-acyl-sn-glycerol-3-phosphate acyltransferase